MTLREGERVCRSPHPPRSGPPSPRGEGLNARQSGRDCECRARRSRSLNPAGRSPSPVSGGLPVRINYGADSGFRRTACLHPRPRVSAGLDFAVRPLYEVLDRGTKKSGACIGTSSTANVVPPSPRGEGLNARQSGRDCECRARRSRSLNPAGRSPSPVSGGLPVRINYGADSGFRRTACLHPRPRVSAGLDFAVRPLYEVLDRGTKKSGACIGTSSTANVVPPSPRGEGLNARQSGRDCEYRAGHAPRRGAFPKSRRVQRGCLAALFQ